MSAHSQRTGFCVYCYADIKRKRKKKKKKKQQPKKQNKQKQDDNNKNKWGFVCGHPRVIPKIKMFEEDLDKVNLGMIRGGTN